MSFYNARWYDAQLGRFVSADTIVPSTANPQAINRYAYVINNPVRLSDPTGHKYSQGSGIGGYECNRFCQWRGHPAKKTVQRIADQRHRKKMKAEVTDWIKRKNVPTTVGTQSSVSARADTFAGLAAQIQGQALFNWYSGEFTLLFNTSGGGYLGTPGGISLDASRGFAAIWGASRAKVLPGPSNYYSVEAGVDAAAKLSGQYSESKVVNYVDENNNGEFETDEFAYLFNLNEDEVFDRQLLHVH